LKDDRSSPARPSPREELHAIYGEVDALLEGWTCGCSRAGVGVTPEAQCCHFGVTGREPYPTAVELDEVRRAMRAAGVTLRQSEARRGGRRLPMADLRPCPLLSEAGRCRVYASRPFGCRTFFCQQAEGPFGSSRRLPRDEIAVLGRRIADLSARFDPRDPRPRPLVRALCSTNDDRGA
jgi:hypothetical protein